MTDHCTTLANIFLSNRINGKATDAPFWRELDHESKTGCLISAVSAFMEKTSIDDIAVGHVGGLYLIKAEMCALLLEEGDCQEILQEAIDEINQILKESLKRRLEMLCKD